MGKASSFPVPYSSLLVSSKITHLTKLYIGMYRIYSIKLATTSNKRPSLWEENLISAHPNPRPPRFCNLLDITSNYHSHTPLQHCSSQSGIWPNHLPGTLLNIYHKRCLTRFTEPIPAEIFFDITSVWFLNVRFSSIKTPRDLVEYNLPLIIGNCNKVCIVATNNFFTYLAKGLYLGLFYFFYTVLNDLPNCLSNSEPRMYAANTHADIGTSIQFRSL